MRKWQATTQTTIEPCGRKEVAAWTIMERGFSKPVWHTIWSSDVQFSHIMKSTSSPGAPQWKMIWWSMGHGEDRCRMLEGEEELMSAVITTLTKQPWNWSWEERDLKRYKTTTVWRGRTKEPENKIITLSLSCWRTSFKHLQMLKTIHRLVHRAKTPSGSKLEQVTYRPAKPAWDKNRRRRGGSK